MAEAVELLSAQLLTSQNRFILGNAQRLAGRQERASYSVQRSPRQYSFSGSGHTAPISLQVPLY